MVQTVYPFFETLLVSQGAAQHAAWHLRRMLRTLQAHGAEPTQMLRDVEARLRDPFDTPERNARLRLEYGPEGYAYRLAPMPTAPYATLLPVAAHHLEYRFKRTDRTLLQAAHAKRGEADDALLIVDGALADTTIANLMLLRQGEWFTPAGSLLPGTKQARYMAELGLSPRQVRLRELDSYERIVAINALRDAEITRIG